MESVLLIFYFFVLFYVSLRSEFHVVMSVLDFQLFVGGLMPYLRSNDFFLKRNPVYLFEMVLMGLKYMKVFLILISY